MQLSSDLSVAVGPVLHPPLLPFICKIDKVLTSNAAKAEVSLAATGVVIPAYSAAR